MQTLISFKDIDMRVKMSIEIQQTPIEKATESDVFHDFDLCLTLILGRIGRWFRK